MVIEDTDPKTCNVVIPVLGRFSTREAAEAFLTAWETADDQVVAMAAELKPCLACSVLFRSASPENRICGTCKRDDSDDLPPELGGGAGIFCW